MSGTVTIEYGNIETITADCIVNAANSGLRRGSGVCGAIFAAAGEGEMAEFCRKIGHCPVGKAVATPPGRLSAKWVIHAVGPYTSRPDAPEMLRSAYVSAMEIVREKNAGRSPSRLSAAACSTTRLWTSKHCGAARSPQSAAGRPRTRTARWTCASSATAAA